MGFASSMKVNHLEVSLRYLDTVATGGIWDNGIGNSSDPCSTCELRPDLQGLE